MRLRLFFAGGAKLAFGRLANDLVAAHPLFFARNSSDVTAPGPAHEPSIALNASGPGTTHGRTLPASAFDFASAPSGQQWTGWIFGLFLAFSVLRIQEIYPSLDVPRLPLVMAGVLMLAVLFPIPGAAWTSIWKTSPIVRCMVGIMLLALATGPIGVWAGGSFWYFKEKFGVQFVAFLIGTLLFRDRQLLRRALTIVILATAWASYLAISGKTGTVGREGQTRVQIAGSLDPNDFGAILVTLIPMALWLGNRSGPRRFFWWSIALLLFVGIVPTASRGSLLGVCAVALVLILQGTSGGKRVMLGGMVGGGALLFSLVVSDAQLARFGSISDDVYNIQAGDGRMAIWKRGVYWMLTRPTGYGLGNFPIYFSWLNGPERAAHNSLVQIGMELGVLALLLYLAIHFYGVRQAKGYRAEAIDAHRRGAAGAEDEGALAGYLIASTAGLFVTGFFLSNAYKGLTMLVFSMLAGMWLGKRNFSASVLANVYTGPASRRQVSVAGWTRSPPNASRRQVLGRRS